MLQIEWPCRIIPGARMRGAELLRFGPPLEGGFALPHRMRGRPRLAFGTNGTNGVIGGAAVRISWIRLSGSKAYGVEKTKIAFIGLGNMGTGIAQCILKSGHDLIVWNRTATKTGPLVALGARAATTAREAAADSDVVITSLMDDKSVLDVVQAGDGVLAGMRPDAVHACVTTISPECGDELESLHRKHGSLYVSLAGSKTCV
jgi:hypothetical protein